MSAGLLKATKGVRQVFTSLQVQFGSLLLRVVVGLIVHLVKPQATVDVTPTLELPVSIAAMAFIIGVGSWIGLVLEVVGKAMCFATPRAAGGKVPLALSLATSVFALLVVPVSILRLATAEGVSASVGGALGLFVLLLAALFFSWYARSLARYCRPELSERATIAICLHGVALVCLIASVVAEVQAKIAESRPQVRAESERPVSTEEMESGQLAPPPPPEQGGLFGQAGLFGKTWLFAGAIGLMFYIWLIHDLRDIPRKVGVT